MSSTLEPPPSTALLGLSTDRMYVNPHWREDTRHCSTGSSPSQARRQAITQEIVSLRHPGQMARSPQSVRWTDHAYVKAGLLGATRADLEQAVVERHHERQVNTGAAQWRLI